MAEEAMIHMKIKTLQLRRDFVLMAYEAGRITRETARAKCLVLTRAIESMAKANLEEYERLCQAGVQERKADWGRDDDNRRRRGNC